MNNKALSRRAANSLDIGAVSQTIVEAARVSAEVCSAAVNQLREIEYLLERRAQQDETIRLLRQASKSPVSKTHPRELSLLRRSYHAIRELHGIQTCTLKGCQYCRLAQEIAIAVGAMGLMKSNSPGDRQ